MGRLSFRISPPEVRGSIVKRLGKPQFWDSGQSFIVFMTDHYDEVTARALDMVLDLER